MLVSPDAFVFLSARFSFNDFPDFLVMELRGDLSDIGFAPFSARRDWPTDHEPTPLCPA